MKAIRFGEFGNAGVLRYEKDVAAPVPGVNEVLVEMKAAALNHLDLWVRGGARERNIPLPHIPGSDGAGVVVATGPGVTLSSGRQDEGADPSAAGAGRLKPGDPVLISPGISCGRCAECLGGRDNLCRSYHVFGTREDGTYAEFVKIPAVNLVPIPEGLSFEEAAAIPLVFLTAWHMLVGLAKVRPGETVLIHGAGSGVGSAGIQIARLFGARVITTAGSHDKLLKARALGADDLIQYREVDFAGEVRRLTDKRGVDIVFEHIGGEVFEKSITILAKGGRLVTCGATTQYTPTLDIRYVYSRHQTIYGSWMGSKRELLEVLKFFAGAAAGEGAPGARKLKPVIDSIFPLAQAREAHERMEERQNFGKIVLSMEGSASPPGAPAEA